MYFTCKTERKVLWTVEGAVQGALHMLCASAFCCAAHGARILLSVLPRLFFDFEPIQVLWGDSREQRSKPPSKSFI